ncbi:MAG TPA: iron ABC transporter permease [Acidimicrobiales bacterium]|nr:iron ABC transporter permease [Acidimicrobiales bacterium]
MPAVPARRTPAGLAVAGAAVAGAAVLPLVYLLLRAGDASDPLGLVGSDRVVGFLWATLRLGVVVTGAALVLGVGLAWLIERTDLPGRRFLAVAAVLPLVVPSYVGALALKAAFGPAGLLVEVPGVIGFWGAAAALALSSYPYVLLMARATLAAGDPALEEAARSLGDSRARAFVRVLLPQLRPSMAAGSLLVFLYVLSDFGAVSILQYDTLTRGIFLEYRSLSPDRSPAAVLGVVLVVLTLAAIGTERLARGRAAPSRAVAGTARPERIGLGRWRWPAVAAVLAVVAAGLGVPVGVLGYWATVGSSGPGAGSVLAGAATTSLALAGAAALVAVVAAIPVALLAVRHRTRFTRAVETLSFSGYALPGLVIALALVFFAAPYPLYQTLSLVVLAYVIRFLPEAIGSVRSSLAQVDPALEDVARSLGRGRLATTATITLPLVRPGLLAGGALVFLTAMKELPATLVLRPPGTDTLAVRVWTGASEGLYAQAAPAALILVVVSALVLWPLNWRGAR